jgi:hypothetical protein
MLKKSFFFLLLLLAPVSWGGSVTTAIAGQCRGDTVATVTIVDTVTNSGRQDARISVLLENEKTVGGVNLTLTSSRPDLLSFSNHIEVIIDPATHETTVTRVGEIDTVGTAISKFGKVYARGDLGDTAFTQCGTMRVMGYADMGQPIEPGSGVLFRLKMDLSCLSDTASERIGYIFITGSLSDPTGISYSRDHCTTFDTFYYCICPNDTVLSDTLLPGCNCQPVYTGDTLYYATVFHFGSLTIDKSKCGDVNGDGKVLLSDVIYLANYVLKSNAPAPCPKEAGYIDNNYAINLSDVILIARYIFSQPTPGTCFSQ